MKQYALVPLYSKLFIIEEKTPNVLLSRHGDIIVDFHDNGVRMDQQVLEHIAEAKTDLRRIWEEYTAAQRQSAVHVKSLGCTAELEIPRDAMEQISGYLHAASEDAYQSEDHTVSRQR